MHIIIPILHFVFLSKFSSFWIFFLKHCGIVSNLSVLSVPNTNIYSVALSNPTPLKERGGMAQSAASSHGDLKVTGSNPSRVDSALHPKLVGKVRSTRDLSHCAAKQEAVTKLAQPVATRSDSPGHCVCILKSV